MIRDATPADAVAVALIWNHYIRDTNATFNSAEKSVEEVRATITTRLETRCFLVAEHAGRVQGFATYDQFRGGIGYAKTMEHTIQLAPDSGGNGFGRALMAALEAHATIAGAHVMVAAVTGENATGRDFHARMGYVQVGLMPQVGRKFGRWMDLLLMQKILS
ncbi:MAG: N-acetyltransferase family protein [Pseudotabrizicola sp.]|uniref:GNAT family N-acetyltransferase n=1 Tax=Pseudotabrizicola sp. TaxID=2939647 RepID=UPI00271A1B7A|nr:GNAT family N-acetyltransferase [Pseudotabrizicola sp.]MDO8884230.1 N-acetyltransferase family protein [Pseudotabrizicola sp.]MDP2080561.1 N-acetyltransferase family protein [Pseudotabrizicola sp.]MDZ7573289.1 N-acetyltransferase family protein [Pseudotabrizicola sp.]